MLAGRTRGMQITLEGYDRPVAVEAGDTILASLLRAGVSFPFSCQAGNCGTCKCELVSGDVLELEYSEHALSPEERAKGVILACRTQIWDDTTIRRIDAEELVLHPSRVLRCRVTALEDLSSEVKGLRLAVEAGGPFLFSAGQYAEVEFSAGASRHYSMANTPEEAELAFHVCHRPGGRTSSHVATRLRIGDHVKVSGPLGVSYLRDAHTGPVLLVAAASGLAPIESILRTLLARAHQAPVTLFFVGELYHEALLRELASRHANFCYHLRAPADADLGELEGLLVYMAGTPAVVEAATGLLVSRGVPRRHIHADAFYDQL
jgi:CDP-4-dehydro-6-deoxyglucose reductase/ferredoxin-NAD(P)+ reductase (naphthalene dioxygenase ferredoxin-specific)